MPDLMLYERLLVNCSHTGRRTSPRLPSPCGAVVASFPLYKFVPEFSQYPCPCFVWHKLFVVLHAPRRMMWSSAQKNRGGRVRGLPYPSPELAPRFPRAELALSLVHVQSCALATLLPFALAVAFAFPWEWSVSIRLIVSTISMYFRSSTALPVSTSVDQRRPRRSRPPRPVALMVLHLFRRLVPAPVHPGRRA